MLSGSEGRDGLTSRGVCGVNSVLLNYQVAIIEYQLLFVFFFFKKKLESVSLKWLILGGGEGGNTQWRT